MRTTLLCAAIILSAITFAFGAGATEKRPGNSNVAQEFEKLKSLAGDWQVIKGPDDHGGHAGTVSYKVTAGSSAVVETLFGGSDHEMVTVYYVDGSDLAMTHYCMLGNRPKMRAQPESTPDKIVFKCQDADNDPIKNEDHMHQATFDFVDADHLKTDWVLYKDGKPAGARSFELERLKK
jgi:hypothetical protein